MKLSAALVVALSAAGMASLPAEGAAAKPAAIRAKDWSLVVTPTPAGGFLMGNPNAKVKLVEYGSMTCPHCARFDEEATPALISNYVKSGKVSFEFRNYVRDAVDVSAALIARCEGARRFFPLTRALFKDQRDWEKKVAAAPSDALNRLQALGPDEQFLAAAKIAGLQQWGAAHGIPVAKSRQCLTDAAAINKLVQMADDTTTQFPDFQGTPSFVINGKLVDFGAITAAEVWPTLDKRIAAALGGTADSTTNGAEN